MSAQCKECINWNNFEPTIWNNIKPTLNVIGFELSSDLQTKIDRGKIKEV